MGDSYDGGESNDGAESNESSVTVDNGDDFSAFADGETESNDAETETSEQADDDAQDDEGDDVSAYENGDMVIGISQETESASLDEMEETQDGAEESAFERDATHEDEQQTDNLAERNAETNEREPGDMTEEEIEALQEQANQAAQEYNAKYSPYERASAKGVEGVTETPNGGVSFENSDALYVTEDGKKGVVTIEATGNRSADFDKANKELGLDEKPDGYTWHHLDNYNVKDNTVTLELVQDDAHNSAKPHSGGCAQYDAVHGPSYNPPKKG